MNFRGAGGRGTGEGPNHEDGGDGTEDLGAVEAEREARGLGALGQPHGKEAARASGEHGAGAHPYLSRRAPTSVAK